MNTTTTPPHSEYHYDLIIIGSGAGLTIANIFAKQHGWKVALVEKGPLGGTCLNRGCIPSKIMIHPADLVQEIERAEEFGITATIENIDFKKIVERATEYTDHSAKAIERGVDKNSTIDLYKAEAYFTGDKSVMAGDTEISGDRVVIAAGTRPFIPPIEGIDEVSFLTSTEALRLDTQPKSMVLVGGGYISAELGNFFGGLGTDITVVEMGDRLAALEDREVSDAFTKAFSDRYPVHLNTQVVKLENANKTGSKKTVTIKNLVSNQKQTIQTEQILIATGRRSNSDLLKLAEHTSIELDQRGYVKTDEYLRTSVDGVWALGDINGTAPFRHAANWESSHLVHYIEEYVPGTSHTPRHRPVDYSIMPHAMFSNPQVAGVGLTEEDAKAADLDYSVKKKNFTTTAMGKALEADGAFVKYIIDQPNNKVVGCHIIGPHASSLIHEVVVLLQAADGDIPTMMDSIHIHPALNEVVQWALYR